MKSGGRHGPMKKVRRHRRLKILGALLLVMIAGAAIPLGMIAVGWLKYRSLERQIVSKMDQYYLTITTPGREQYLLSDDEVFEVPYMASQLSVQAVPTRIYDRHEELIGEFTSEKGLYVTDVEDLPLFLKKALVAAEDGDFYEHHGVNLQAIARAFFVNFRSGHTKQGGSTLTQQLAKLLFTTRSRKYSRKIFEAFCARKLESKFTKDQILLMYLNFIYFGHGQYGVESASRYYFNKSTKDLALGEAVLLAGIIASPNNYSPFVNPELAQARHRTVLSRMAKLGFVSALATGRYTKEFWAGMQDRMKRPDVSFWRTNVNKAPYIIEHVRRRLVQEFPKERIIKGGLRIHTTFDLELQKAARRALEDGLSAETARELEFKESQTSGLPQVQGGLAALQVSDGAILAIVGGSGFDFRNQLNRARDIARPIGSTVKPFIYAAAFESGKFSPADMMLDKPISFRRGGGRTWSPNNYGDRYYGEVTLETALQKSLNSVAVRLLGALKIESPIRLLSDATGRPPSYFPRNLTLALGTVDLSPLETVAAFAVFANDGLSVRPHSLTRIETRDGEVIREYPPKPPLTALSPEAAHAVRVILEGVLKPGGTAGAAALRAGFNLPAAGKTGTTNENRDAWFTGFTPEIAASVWVGHDDMRVPLGKSRTGGSVAAPIWMDFMKRAYRNRPTKDFPPKPKNP